MEPLQVAGRAATRARSAWEIAPTRCSSATCRTSAGSPASPARTAGWSSRPTSWSSSPTVATAIRRRRRWPPPVSTARVRVGATTGAINDLLAATVKPSRTLGFESAHVTYAQFRAYESAMSPHARRPRRCRRGRATDEGRRRDRPHGRGLPHRRRRPGRGGAAPDVRCDLLTEAEVRNLLEIRMRELGADGPSYETIVATGPTNAALPHHRPTHTRIEDGHTVVVDVGALYDGYHSDMTRTLRGRRAHRAAARAVRAGARRPGARGRPPSAPGCPPRSSTRCAATPSPRPVTATGSPTGRATASGS